MSEKFPTLIWRHRRENLKKCSLRGLESRTDMRFFTYPKNTPPISSDYIILSLEGDPLSEKDKGLLLLDGTWRLAEKMHAQLPENIPKRRIPKGFVTAYPRRQEDCMEPDSGLASVEALYIAYTIMGKDPSGLLDHYHWKELFLERNRGHL
ncbi:MAG: hypothetical protein SNF33_05705 [Candidatus Algichlamydia australiensis]|nr:hypothetical protein [Chlamydiales bacterium]